MDLGIPYYLWLCIKLIINLPSNEQVSQRNHYIHENYWLAILEQCCFFTCVVGEELIYFLIEIKIQATHVTLSAYGGKTLELVGYV